MKMLIAGSSLWVLGSIHNSCQIYERADGHVQVLQESVHIPFLMGSLLFLVGSVINCREQAGTLHHGLDLFVSHLCILCKGGYCINTFHDFYQVNDFREFYMLNSHVKSYEYLVTFFRSDVVIILK